MTDNKRRTPSDAKSPHWLWHGELKRILKCEYLLVMGIGHIFKIDDRYTNIDRWSIISDHYLLNIFTDYNYSNREKNDIVSYKNTHNFFFICCGRWWFKNILTGTLQILENVVVEIFLLNRICYSFSSVIQEYWDCIIDDFTSEWTVIWDTRCRNHNIGI